MTGVPADLSIDGTEEREGVVSVDTCQLCGSDRRQEMFREGPWRVVRCSDCTFVYLTPRIPDDKLLEVYGHDYWQSEAPREKGYSDYAADRPLYLKTFRRRSRLVDRYLCASARVLDVGCAAGFFLEVMKERGHQVFGVEVSAAIAEHARERLGAERIHVGTLETAPKDAGFTDHSFDLVTLWDVIEHVADPQAMLRACRRMLKPNGVLILETQNVTSLWARLTGRRWQHYKHEEHIYHFNPATVARILEDTGYRVERTTTSYGGKYVSCGFIAERARRLHPLVGFLLRPLALLRRLNFYLNLRDEMVVVARPTGS